MRPAGWGAVPAGRRSSSPTRRAGARGRRRRPGSKLVTGGDGGLRRTGRAGDRRPEWTNDRPVPHPVRSDDLSCSWWSWS